MTTHLTQWKKEASDNFFRKFPPLYGTLYSEFLDTLIDRIHAHTLEEVRGIVKAVENPYEGEGVAVLAARNGFYLGRFNILAALELLEHPTD